MPSLKLMDYFLRQADKAWYNYDMLTLLHSERPKLYGVLAFLNAIGLTSLVLVLAFWGLYQIKFYNNITKHWLKQNSVISTTCHLLMITVMKG